MKPERIKSLIDLMVDSDLCELSLTEGDAQLRLLREPGQPVAPVITAPSARPATAQPQVAAAAPSVSANPVCASLYGVLHLTPAPDQPPFVEVGAQVEVGQTLAVIEAMKMFHPIKADVAGVLSDILASAGEEVQAGQALFRIG